MTAQAKITLNKLMGWIGLVSFFVGGIFTISAFVAQSKNTSNELPLLQKIVKDHEEKDESDKMSFIQAIAEIKSSVKVVETKLDDMKENGRGAYKPETLDTVNRLKRNKNPKF